MPDLTTNLKLTKPLQTEYYDVDVFNQNADILDVALSGALSRITTNENDIEDILGNISGMLPASLDLPNGSLSIGDLLIQWGILETNGTAVATVAFNKPFAEIYNVQYSVQDEIKLATDTSNGTAYTKNISILQISNTLIAFDVTNAVLASNNTFKIHWLVIGKKAITTTAEAD